MTPTPSTASRPAAGKVRTGPLLEVEGLSKRYGRRMAVDGLSFSVQPGEIYGFLGKNGAGKSTTIRMVLGLVWPTSGSIEVAGHRVRPGRPPSYWPVGAIVESPVFYDYLTARKNLQMLTSLSGGTTRHRIDEILELVGLTERADEPVSVYSHGMRQRLGLAQALLPGPQLIILDEPLDGLDPKGIREVRDVMHEVVRAVDVSIVYSSHLLAEVELTCDRVLIIDQGRKLYEGDLSGLLSRAGWVTLRVGPAQDPRDLLGRLPFIEKAERTDGRWRLEMPTERVPELTREVVRAGLDVLEIAPHRTSLEDIFLNLTGSPTPVASGVRGAGATGNGGSSGAPSESISGATPAQGKD